MIYYNSLNNYLQKTFGEKVYRLSLTSSCDCPHRKNGVGCIFCDGGSGDFAPPYGMPLDKQIEFAKRKITEKTKAQKFIAYFGNYTSTYGDLEYQRELFLSSARREDVVAVSVATRPDCLSGEVIEVLKEVAKIKPVWVELGLQTSNDLTAELINRGYKTAIFDEAVKRLKTDGFSVIAHMIAFLPGESGEDMISTARHIGDTGCDGIKIQLLHVVKNTPLYNMYLEGKVPTPTLKEYINILEKCVAVLPENMIIHRLTGDGNRKNLVSPLWSADKKRVLNEIRKNLLPK